jgi:hypothetical protein
VEVPACECQRNEAVRENEEAMQTRDLVTVPPGEKGRTITWKELVLWGQEDLFLSPTRGEVQDLISHLYILPSGLLRGWKNNMKKVTQLLARGKLPESSNFIMALLLEIKAKHRN